MRQDRDRSGCADRSDRSYVYPQLPITSPDPGSAPTVDTPPSSGLYADPMGSGTMTPGLAPSMPSDGGSAFGSLVDADLAGSGPYAFNLDADAGPGGGDGYGAGHHHNMLEDWGAGGQHLHGTGNAAHGHGSGPPHFMCETRHAPVGHLQQSLYIPTNAENREPTLGQAMHGMPHPPFTPQYWPEPGSFPFDQPHYPGSTRQLASGTSPLSPSTPYCTSAISPIYHTPLFPSPGLEHGYSNPGNPISPRLPGRASAHRFGRRHSVVASSSVPTVAPRRRHSHSAGSRHPQSPEEREIALERNRVAANRFRMRRKDELMKLAAQERLMEERCSELSACAAGLRQEISFLKGQLLAHADCDCILIQQYLANMAQGHVEAERRRRRARSASRERGFDSGSRAGESAGSDAFAGSPGCSGISGGSIERD